LVLDDDVVGKVKVTDVSKFDGDVTLSNRKGKVISYYELVIEAKWEAIHENGEDKANGTLTIPNISEENDADDIEVSVTVKKSTPYGKKVKDLIRKAGLKKIQAFYGDFKEKLMKEYSLGMIKTKGGNKQDGNAAAAAKVSANINKIDKLGVGVKSKPSISTGTSVKESTSSVSYEEDIECGCDDLYAVFTEKDRFSAFTQSTCEVEPVVGKEISLCNGFITGKVLELDENKKIVLEMRESNWAEGLVSKASIEFKFKSSTGTTKFMVTQTGIPKSKIGECAERWKVWCRRIRLTFGYGAIPL